MPLEVQPGILCISTLSDPLCRFRVHIFSTSFHSFADFQTSTLLPPERSLRYSVNDIVHRLLFPHFDYSLERRYQRLSSPFARRMSFFRSFPSQLSASDNSRKTIRYNHFRWMHSSFIVFYCMYPQCCRSRNMSKQGAVMYFL